MSVAVVLVGVGGYGSAHYRTMVPAISSGAMRLVAAVDPAIERAADYGAIKERKTPIWKSFEEFLAAGVQAELAVLATPIQFHASQGCLALERGLNLLCEKPAAASLAELAGMIQARDRAALMAAIGYQWSFSTSMRRLKHDVATGRYGRPLRLRTWVAWPRDSNYYSRNNWAGKIHDPQGRLVNDSPVNNATAHYLHNMFYILGCEAGAAATSCGSISAELYRAHPIENFDTAALRVELASGAEVLFYTSHALEQHNVPIFSYEFEEATVVNTREPGRVSAILRNGSVIDYGDPNSDGTERKLTDTLAAVADGSGTTPCSLETAGMQTRVVDALQQMTIHTWPAAECRTTEVADGARQHWLPGLYAALEHAYNEGRLFSELNYPWAVAAQQRML